MSSTTVRSDTLAKTAEVGTIEMKLEVVRLTPRHSECSVTIGKGITSTEPGSVQRFELIVSDIVAAREDLIRSRRRSQRGVRTRRGPLLPGPDPQRRQYLTYASFNDPDGNGWLLQEVTSLPQGLDRGRWATHDALPAVGLGTLGRGARRGPPGRQFNSQRSLHEH